MHAATTPDPAGLKRFTRGLWLRGGPRTRLVELAADLREIIADHPDLQERLPELEGRLDYYDAEEAVFASVSGPGS